MNNFMFANTGFGVNDYSISGFLHTTDDDTFKEYTIITEDIDTINKIVDEEQDNEKKKFETFCKKQYAKVKRINALPKTFKTVENAYQAAKEENFDRRKLYQSITPKQAKQLGRKATLRKDWEEVKLEIMEVLVRKKFQNPSLKKKLIATGDQWIIEGNEWGDIFWGVYKGRGSNHLGRILMKIRQEYNEKGGLK